jgi:3-hydroxybutyryl-CoA dehydrogenase/5-formyl-3-hydroxy-2-methylpyridine 4-carboxylate dehydrogenase
LSNRADVAAYMEERTSQRKLGIKTGSGIYDYTPAKIAELQSLRARKLVAVRKALQA